MSSRDRQGTYFTKIKILEDIIRKWNGTERNVPEIVDRVNRKDYEYSTPPYFRWNTSVHEIGWLLTSLN